MTIHGLRWRIAKLVAPVPIIAKPDREGPAILLSGDGPYQAWLFPKTLDVQMDIVPFKPRENELWSYTPHKSTGTITGTI
jgi:hypothetical protein